MHKSATSTWELYIQKSEAYDNILVTDYSSDAGLGASARTTPDIEWTNVMVTSIPTGSVLARMGGIVNKANRLNVTNAIGSSTEPVYINSDGLAVKCDKYLVPIHIAYGTLQITDPPLTVVSGQHASLECAFLPNNNIVFSDKTVLNAYIDFSKSFDKDSFIYSIAGYRISGSNVRIFLNVYNKSSSIQNINSGTIPVRVIYMQDDEIV